MSCPNHPQWLHGSEDCPLCAATRRESNPDLNKFQTRDPVVETLMNELAQRIQQTLPGNMRFALFLFEETEDNVNIFYAASARTADLLPLINQWAERQQN